jgi:NADPH2:quinone reductase
MRAVRIYQTGGPDVLKPEEVSVPSPGPGELVVRTEAIGVPYYEVQMRAAVFPSSGAWPAVFGHEAASIVVEAGDAAMVGRRVVVVSTTGGAYAEYLVAAESAVTPIPDGVSAVDAVAVAVPAAVALTLLRAAELTGTESVLVEVAAGSVGRYLTQLARSQGAARVFATAGGGKRDHVKEFGVEAVFDHRAPDWVDLVPERTSGDFRIQIHWRRFGEEAPRQAGAGL